MHAPASASTGVASRAIEERSGAARRLRPVKGMGIEGMGIE
jgi:hypothetical protein